MKIDNVIPNKNWIKIEHSLPNIIKAEEEIECPIIVDTNMMRIRDRSFTERGKITLNSNDPYNPSLKIPLEVKIEVKCPLKWERLDFGRLIVGETKELSVKIRNMSKSKLRIEIFTPIEDWIKLPHVKTPIELSPSGKFNFTITTTTSGINRKSGRIQNLKGDIKVNLLDDGVYSRIYPQIIIPVEGIVKFKRWWVRFSVWIVKSLILLLSVGFTIIFISGIIAFINVPSYRTDIGYKLLGLTGLLGPVFLFALLRKIRL